MIVTSKRVEETPVFKPVELKLKISSQKEFDMIHFIFNYTPLCEVMGSYAEIKSSKVRDALERVGGNPEIFNVIHNELRDKLGLSS